MRVCWIVLVLLGFGLSRADESLNTCDCKGLLKTVCVPAGHSVFVPCEHTKAEEVLLTLFKDQEIIHVCTHLKNTTRPAENTIDRSGLGIRINTTDTSIGLVLSGVTANNSGLYECVAQNIFPPPIVKRCNESKVLLLVEGHQCKCNTHCDSPTGGGGQTPLWIWILGFVGVSTYGLAATIIALVNWVRLRRAECQTDYMNTNPRAPKGHKRQKRFQQPIPRHF